MAGATPTDLPELRKTTTFKERKKHLMNTLYLFCCIGNVINKITNLLISAKKECRVCKYVGVYGVFMMEASASQPTNCSESMFRKQWILFEYKVLFYQQMKTLHRTLANFFIIILIAIIFFCIAASFLLGCLLHNCICNCNLARKGFQ